MQFLYSALSSNELKALHILPPAHLYTPTPSQVLSGDTTQIHSTRATGDQCIIAFSACCQVFIYGCQSETGHISGTNLAQVLYVQKTKRTAGVEPTISWLRV